MNIALFLSADGIALAHRQRQGHWAMIGETALDVPDLDGVLAGLRAEAAAREGDGFEALLVLPDDQILYTSLTAPTGDPELTAFRIEEGLDGLTPYTIAELEYDWRVQEQDRVKIAVVARETLDEARAFAAEHGFVAGGFAAMPPMQRFPGVPLFGLSETAQGLDFSAEGIAFGPDSFGQPDPEPEPEPEPEPGVTPEAERAPEAGIAAEAEAEADLPLVEDEARELDTAPEPAPEPEPDTDGLAARSAEDAPDTDTAAAARRDTDRDPLFDEAGDLGPDFDEIESDNPALAEALRMMVDLDPTEIRPVRDPTQSGPVPPLDPGSGAGTDVRDHGEDRADAMPPAQDPYRDHDDAGPTGTDWRDAPDADDPWTQDDAAAIDGDADLPPPPAPAALLARQRAGSGFGPGRAADAPPAESGFAALRARIAAPDTDRDSLVGQRSARIGLAPVERPAAAGPLPQPPFGTARGGLADDPDAEGEGDGGAGGSARMPRLAEQLERVRAASKTRPKPPARPTEAQARMPRVEIDTTGPLAQSGLSAERRPSAFGLPAPGAADPAAPAAGGFRSILGGMRRGRAAPAPAASGRPGKGSTGAAGGAAGGFGTARAGAPAPEGTRSALAAPVERSVADPRLPDARPPEIRAADRGGAAVLTGETEAFASGLLARKSAAAGPSFRTGLILTVILLLLLALVAIWSAIFLPDSPVARLLGWSDGDTAAATAGPDDADGASVAPPASPLPGAPAALSAPPSFGLADGGAPAVDPDVMDEAAADGFDIAAPAGGVVPSNAAPAAAASPDTIPRPGADTGQDPGTAIAALPAAGTNGEAATDPQALLQDIDADFDLPPLPAIDPGQNPTQAEAEALYAEDGIWARSPDRPDLRPFDLLDQIYTAALDPAVAAVDAIALPDPGVNPGELLRRYPPPPAFGAAFDLTAGGLVAPTPEGVLTPEGAFVISGPPPVAAQPRPAAPGGAAEAPVIDTDAAILSAFRPTERPATLSETRERQLLGGLTTDELGSVRPPERPLSPQEAAARAALVATEGTGAAPLLDGPDAEIVEAAVAAAIGGSDLAIARSLLPRQRPANIADIVASAARPAAAPVTEVAVAVAAEAVAAAPDIPSNADVSRAATERDAIRLRDVNLIGVTGTPSDRRALVRLSSGRFVRVGVGDRLDGGRVAAIGETSLQYVRNGRTVTLQIPG